MVITGFEINKIQSIAEKKRLGQLRNLKCI